MSRDRAKLHLEIINEHLTLVTEDNKYIPSIGGLKVTNGPDEVECVIVTIPTSFIVR